MDGVARVKICLVFKVGDWDSQVVCGGDVDAKALLAPANFGVDSVDESI